MEGGFYIRALYVCHDCQTRQEEWIRKSFNGSPKGWRWVYRQKPDEPEGWTENLLLCKDCFEKNKGKCDPVIRGL